MHHSPQLLLVAAATLASPWLLGCSDSDGSSGDVENNTLITVDPADFAGGEGCGEPGGLGAYVATLVDVTGDMVEGNRVVEEFFVDTTPPTACTRALGFGTVFPDRAYEAIVEGYLDADGDPATMDICSVEGSRIAVAREDGECSHSLVTPAKVWRCFGWQSPSGDASKNGQGRGNPAIAIEYRSVSLHDCRPTD